MERVIVVGGSDAGISAALRIKELRPEVVPTVITADEFPNYSICGLPYLISGEVEDWRRLAHRTLGEIEANGIDVLTNHTVHVIDEVNQRVTVAGADGEMTLMEYDKLILATGAVSLKPSIPGIDTPGVLFLRWVPDCLAMDDFINTKQPRSAVIIGAGYIGMEMAEALTQRGMEVTVVEFSPWVLPSLDEDVSRVVADEMGTRGASVYCNTSVESICGSDGGLSVKGSGGLDVRADMVLVATGSAPNTALGMSIGISTGSKGALKVTKRMETTVPNVYAAGDCVEAWHRVLEQYVYLPLGTVAHKQGRIAGENSVGGNREYAGTLGTQSVKLFSKVAARTGLTSKEARRTGISAVDFSLDTYDHKVYYPTAKELHIKVTADSATGMLIGAQMVGEFGTEVSKRLDILQTAIFHKMLVSDFCDYDLSYTPPLSSPWDPVQMAVMGLARSLGR